MERRLSRSLDRQRETLFAHNVASPARIRQETCDEQLARSLQEAEDAASAQAIVDDDVILLSDDDGQQSPTARHAPHPTAAEGGPRLSDADAALARRLQEEEDARAAALIAQAPDHAPRSRHADAPPPRSRAARLQPRGSHGVTSIRFPDEMVSTVPFASLRPFAAPSVPRLRSPGSRPPLSAMRPTRAHRSFSTPFEELAQERFAWPMAPVLQSYRPMPHAWEDPFAAHQEEEVAAALERNDYDALLQLDENAVRVGIQDIDVVSLASRLQKPLDDNCVICMEAMEAGQMVRRLRCTCTFHEDCIQEHLQSNTLCPICRIDVREEG